MGTNEGGLDRAVRVLLGGTLIWLATLGGVITGAWGTAAIVFGVILLVTGATGFCGLYRVVGINTCSRG